jgi:PPM family protein phosphatase
LKYIKQALKIREFEDYSMCFRRQNKRKAGLLPKQKGGLTLFSRHAVYAQVTDRLRVLPYNSQHIGARQSQEDSFAFSNFSDQWLVKNKGLLAVLADGMGGLDKGDMASQTAVSTFMREFMESGRSEAPSKILQRSIKRANYAVFDLAFIELDSDYELGTTVASVLVRNNKLHWVSAGDSRVYLLRNQQLKQLNHDHIYYNYLLTDVKKGIITEKEAALDPERNALTSYLGLPELVEISTNKTELELLNNDLVLICSDGLYNTLTDEEINEILINQKSNPAEELVKRALLKMIKYQDNITALILVCTAN